MRYYCTEERHPSGGFGSFYLADVEKSLNKLKKMYKNSIQLIYLDPPFGASDTFSLKLKKGQRAVRVPLYRTQLPKEEYLSWMQSVLKACHEMLTPSGCIYLHIDYRLHASMKLLLDNIFGEDNLMNEIVWCYKSGGRSTRCFPKRHDTILFYRKGRRVFFDIKAVGKPRGTQRRNHMKRFVDEDGRIGFSIRSKGKLYKYYEDTPIFPSDVWDDIDQLQQKDRERLGFAMQKPEALLRRIILASSREGDTVMDLFCGSGTTAAVAANLGRKFVAVDISPIALYTLRKRLLTQSSMMSLLDVGSRELTITYPKDMCDAEIDSEVVVKGSTRTLIIHSVNLSGTDAPLIYAAVGTVKSNCFKPFAINCHPKLPQKIQLPREGEAVLQVVDAYGHQAFISVT
ncbi:MAG: site-specific DNA-methyltransferase [Clostridia bacterium]|nr:site-specific DNA-methyltransferase [Clostridia bacterium]